jgi:hypothetical protein
MKDERSAANAHLDKLWDMSLETRLRQDRKCVLPSVNSEGSLIKGTAKYWRSSGEPGVKDVW